jgi:TetR/AcrR family transcriptional regulator, mexJK operon transcriptional repressor
VHAWQARQLICTRVPDPSSTSPTADADPDSRSSRKRDAILEAATAAFLRNGYVGTSMDEVAALAGASKQTVYKHFADKERLFAEIVTTTVADASDTVNDALRTLDDTGDIDADLRDLARRQLKLVMQPRILQLRRLVIGEAARFPALGRLFYEQGPGRTISGLASAFEQLGARGVLEIDDPALAAAHFNWLIMSAPLNQAMLLGDDAIPGRAQLDRIADAGVRTFLAAYRRV